MMSENEYLLIVLAEECGEVIENVAKALRFSLEDHHPNDFETNESKLKREIVDVIAVAEMLVENKVIEDYNSREMIENKKKKVKKYMEYSRHKNILQ